MEMSIPLASPLEASAPLASSLEAPASTNEPSLVLSNTKNAIPQPYRYQHTDLLCTVCSNTILDERIPGTLCLQCAIKDRHSRGPTRQFFCDDCGEPVPIVTASLDFQIQSKTHRTFVDWTDTHTIGDEHQNGHVILRCRENCNGTHCQKCNNTFDKCQCNATIDFYSDARPGRYEVEDTVIRKAGKPTLSNRYERRYAIDFMKISLDLVHNEFGYAGIIHGDTYHRPLFWKNDHCLNLIDPEMTPSFP